MKYAKGFHPKNLMDRIRARKKKPRNTKPTPSPKDAKPADAKSDVKKQGDHEQVDEGKKNPNKKPCPKKGKPVNPILGCKMLFGGEDFDWSLPSAMPLTWQRQYFSDAGHTGWFGQGWTLDFWRQLQINDRQHIMVDDQGREVFFSRISADNYEKRDYNIWDKLTHFVDEADGYVVEDTGGTRYIFRSLPLIEQSWLGKSPTDAQRKAVKARIASLTRNGKVRLPLREIRDRNGNALKLFSAMRPGFRRISLTPPETS
jgi:Domain of unknown function (DUF6531)